MDSHGEQLGDDAVTRMTKAPRLSRNQEITLAEKIYADRMAYHDAVFRNAYPQAIKFVSMLVQGKVSLESSIQTVQSRGITLESVLGRLRPNYETLLGLERRMSACENDRSRHPLQRGIAMANTTDKMATLLSELSLRTHLVKDWHRDVLECDKTPMTELRLIQSHCDELKKGRQTYAEGNTRLVVHVAKWYRNRGIDFPELCQEGVCGLMRAIDSFDPGLKWTFGTYATWWIKQRILRAIPEIMGYSAHWIAEIARVNNHREQFMHIHHRAPTREEEMRALGYEQKDLFYLQLADGPLIKQDFEMMNDDGRAISFTELIEDDGPTNDILEQNEMRERIEILLKTLLPREADVLRMRFGLDGEGPKTLREIGRKKKLTRERIRQIEARAKSKCLEPHRAQMLDGYMDPLEG